MAPLVGECAVERLVARRSVSGVRVGVGHEGRLVGRWLERHAEAFDRRARTAAMTERQTQERDEGPAPLVRRADEVVYQDVDAAEGMRKGVLVGEDDGAPNLALRRFVLSPGAEVPRHPNEIEHEQYVLEGTYTVGLGDEEYEVSAGDSLLIPAGTVHWYRNEGETEGAFICAVPTGDDQIQLA